MRKYKAKAVEAYETRHANDRMGLQVETCICRDSWKCSNLSRGGERTPQKLNLISIVQEKKKKMVNDLHAPFIRGGSMT